MIGSMRKFSALVRRVANEGGHKGKFIYRKTRQTRDLLFFVRKL